MVGLEIECSPHQKQLSFYFSIGPQKKTFHQTETLRAQYKSEEFDGKSIL
jgi:hypothetical protein